MLVCKRCSDANILTTRKHAHLSQQQALAWEAHRADAEQDCLPLQPVASDLLSRLQYDLDNHHHHISKHTCNDCHAPIKT